VTQFLWPQKQPTEILAEARLLYNPIRSFALFSGGNDSIVTTHLSMSTGLVDEVLHINTGIGIPETRQFVQETCKALGWPLREIHAEKGQYEKFVRKYGFPGPQAHKYSYVWLKERPLKKLIRETKTKRMDKIFLITGVRNLESARRMGYVAPVRKDGASIWVAPAFQWSKLDLHAYKKKHNLPTSPVVEKFHMSGECLCGAYAHENEMQELEEHFPIVSNRIHLLEKEMEGTGKPCVWGHRGKWEDEADQEDDSSLFRPMCVGCAESKRRQI
jgi:3'-phosphoadenosine 5'-phosphosulfate sulfotransferase (PAPS reductase)/FAD synthetase